ncbi:MAG: histidine kinase dimerization/phosphoacceptor domain -containing protein [Syntrophobacter sp.]
MRLSPFRGPVEADEEKTRMVSLNAFLTRLIWLCVMPLVIFAVYLSVIHVLTLQDQHDQEAANLARNVATSIDHYIGAQISALRMLASSPFMDDPPRLEEFYGEATGFRESFGGEVVLVDLSAQLIFNTRVPFGAPQPKLPVPRGRSAVSAALTNGGPAVGDMFVGPDSKQALVASAVPLVRDGNVKSVLVNIVGIGEIEQNLDEVALPVGWSLMVLDGNNEVIARRSPPDAGGHPVDDEPPGRFSVKCASSHWTVVLDVPRDVYRKPLIAAAAALSAAVLFLTLFSVLGGRMAGRQLARSVAALAEVPSRSASPPLISEIEAVRVLLNESAAAREAAELTRLETEERFRQLFDIAPIPLCFVSKDGFLIRSNARFGQTFGYGDEDASSITNWSRLAYPDPEYRRWVLRTWDTAVRRARENNTDIEPIEYRVRCKDGRVLTVVTSGTIIADGFLATFFDITERKQAEEALVLERNKFRQFLDALPVGVYIASNQHEIEYVNPVMQSAFGPIEGRKCHDYFHGKAQVCPLCKNPQIVAGNTVRWEWFSERMQRTYDRIATPVHNGDGSISKLEVFLDITARKKAEQALRDSLEEKVALLKEVHHRVKNNLQVVASLLGLQASRSINQQVVDVLQDTRNRVKSMAMLHEALYRSGNLARINFAGYMKDLCGQLLLSYGPVASRVKLENEVARIALPLEHAVPCGLIASELVTNALKHGFPGERTGRIVVRLEPVHGQLILSVSDDGVGLPPDWDPSGTSTLGLQLISRLAGQLGGKMELLPSHGQGAAFHVIFPVPENTLLEGE